MLKEGLQVQITHLEDAHEQVSPAKLRFIACAVLTSLICVAEEMLHILQVCTKHTHKQLPRVRLSLGLRSSQDMNSEAICSCIRCTGSKHVSSVLP